MEVQVGDQSLTAHAGTIVYAPKNSPHSFRIVGSAPALIQITMIPGGLEKMVEELIQLPSPPDHQKVEAICDKFGVKFLAH